MISFRDSYFFDYEISNHNLLVNEDGTDLMLINQILPLQYRLEYEEFLSHLYEEQEYELNEQLLLKKLIFLLIALAKDDGV
jgi:hypothetical protein